MSDYNGGIDYVVVIIKTLLAGSVRMYYKRLNQLIIIKRGKIQK